MPYVDGIELSKWIHENKPSIKVVLVSAFAEFEYAKLALLYNVIYYLLKAIDEEELKTVLYHIKDVLDCCRAVLHPCCLQEVQLMLKLQKQPYYADWSLYSQHCLRRFLQYLFRVLTAN